jgi:hypothetical protein
MVRESRKPQPTDAERFAKTAEEFEAGDDQDELSQAFERVVRAASEAATRTRVLARDSKRVAKSRSDRPG